MRLAWSILLAGIVVPILITLFSSDGNGLELVYGLFTFVGFMIFSGVLFWRVRRQAIHNNRPATLATVMAIVALVLPLVWSTLVFFALASMLQNPR